MKNQKKWELLKFAYDNYPKGVLARFKTAPKVDHISTGKFRIIEGTGNGTCVISEDDNHCFYTSHGNEWAEIVKPKIAVKVENEKEFKALMKYYDSLGWKSWGDHNIDGSFNIGDCIDFHDEYRSTYKSIQENQGYQIIPFADFAEEKGIKLPLITSEDGVDLYEGGTYFHSYLDTDLKWKFNDIFNGTGSMLQCDHNVVVNKEKNKAFSTKQAALEWIEAQKPKPIYTAIGERNIDVLIYRDGTELIQFKQMGKMINVAHLTFKEMRDINDAMTNI